MTSGIFDTIATCTGERPLSCPWRAFYDPFVRRVIDAYCYFESGQLAWHQPIPSHRLVEGVGFYHRVDGVVHANKLKQEREQMEAEHGR